MKDGLQQAYEMILEKAKEGTVKTNMTTGSPAAGELKKAKGGGPEDTDVKKPTEGEAKINPGHGKIKTEATNARGLSSMLPQSKFDDLFKKQIVEEDDISSDESPVEMTGENEFDDEQGDFPEVGETGDETAEEVDVATELRMIIDRLSEVAERLGAYDEGMDEADMETAETEEMPEEPTEELAPESVQAKMKPMKNSVKQMQSKKNVVKSAFKASGKKAATTNGPGKGAADGKLNAARKTTLGPKMSQKVEVKGTMGKPGAGLFDEI